MAEDVLERGALAAHHALRELERKPPRDPTEPLYTKGGVLDPDAWCMKAAVAVRRGKKPPRIYKDVACPDWIIERVREAMGA